jgi:hypothetical protein
MRRESEFGRLLLKALKAGVSLVAQESPRGGATVESVPVVLAGVVGAVVVGDAALVWLPQLGGAAI